MNAEHHFPGSMKKLCALACVLVWSMPSLGQSLSDVYQMALGHDSQYLSARKTFDAAIEKLPQARAGLLPSVNLTGGKNQQAGDASFAYAPYVSRDVKSWNWTVALTQPLIRPVSWSAYAQAQLQVDQAQAQLNLAEQDLLLRTAQVYLDVQVAQQSVQVAQAQWQAMTEQLQLAQRTFDVGIGTITDVHEAKAKQALSLSQKINAINDLSIKQAELERIVNRPISLQPMQLTAGPPALSAEQMALLLTAAGNQNHQVRIQQATVLVAEHELSKAWAAHAPTLDLTLNHSANFNSGSLSSPYDSAVRTRAHQVGVVLNIPLYAGGSMQSKIRESLAMKDKAQADLENAQRTAHSQVRQAFAGIENGQAQVEALIAGVQASQNAVTSNKIGYRIGTRINSEVLNSEQLLYAAMRDLSKARAELVMQSLKLKAATGSLVSQDLSYLDQWMAPTEGSTSSVP